jgi:hypothetical protein
MAIYRVQYKPEIGTKYLHIQLLDDSILTYNSYLSLAYKDLL